MESKLGIGTITEYMIFKRNEIVVWNKGYFWGDRGGIAARVIAMCRYLE